MRIEASGAPAHLSQSLEQEMLAAGVPDDVDVFAAFEVPCSMKGVAAHGVRDFWFFAKSEGNPAIVKKAESEDERHAASRAVGYARAKTEKATAPYQAPPESDEATAFDDEHPGTAEVSTPDMAGGDHPKWHLQRAAPSAMDTLKSLAARLESLVPAVERLHPLQKSFLLASGHPAADVDSLKVAWSPDLTRKYQKWLVANVRHDAASLLGRR